MKNVSGPPTGLSDSGLENPTSDKPRHWGTVGLTEQRLRAANKKAWMESTNGWSEFFGRFMTSSKARTP
jgi:hypothetical protein